MATNLKNYADHFAFCMIVYVETHCLNILFFASQKKKKK